MKFLVNKNKKFSVNKVKEKKNRKNLYQKSKIFIKKILNHNLKNNKKCLRVIQTMIKNLPYLHKSLTKIHITYRYSLFINLKFIYIFVQ